MGLHEINTRRPFLVYITLMGSAAILACLLYSFEPRSLLMEEQQNHDGEHFGALRNTIRTSRFGVEGANEEQMMHRKLHSKKDKSAKEQKKYKKAKKSSNEAETSKGELTWYPKLDSADVKNNGQGKIKESTSKGSASRSSYDDGAKISRNKLLEKTLKNKQSEYASKDHNRGKLHASGSLDSDEGPQSAVFYPTKATQDSQDLRSSDSAAEEEQPFSSSSKSRFFTALEKPTAQASVGEEEQRPAAAGNIRGSLAAPPATADTVPAWLEESASASASASQDALADSLPDGPVYGVPQGVALREAFAGGEAKRYSTDDARARAAAAGAAFAGRIVDPDAAAAAVAEAVAPALLSTAGAAAGDYASLAEGGLTHKAWLREKSLSAFSLDTGAAPPPPAAASADGTPVAAAAAAFLRSAHLTSTRDESWRADAVEGEDGEAAVEEEKLDSGAPSGDEEAEEGGAAVDSEPSVDEEGKGQSVDSESSTDAAEGGDDKAAVAEEAAEEEKPDGGAPSADEEAEEGGAPVDSEPSVDEEGKGQSVDSESSADEEEEEAEGRSVASEASADGEEAEEEEAIHEAAAAAAAAPGKVEDLVAWYTENQLWRGGGQGQDLKAAAAAGGGEQEAAAAAGTAAAAGGGGRPACMKHVGGDPSSPPVPCDEEGAAAAGGGGGGGRGGERGGGGGGGAAVVTMGSAEVEAYLGARAEAAARAQALASASADAGAVGAAAAVAVAVDAPSPSAASSSSSSSAEDGGGDGAGAEGEGAGEEAAAAAPASYPAWTAPEGDRGVLAELAEDPSDYYQYEVGQCEDLDGVQKSYRTYCCARTDLPALGGVDVVDLFAQAEGGANGAALPRPGRRSLQATLRTSFGTYAFLFRSEENQRAFQKDPWRYVPAYGGFCACGLALEPKVEEEGYQSKLGPYVSLSQWAVQDDRLFFFGGPEPAAAFAAAAGENAAQGDAHWSSFYGGEVHDGAINTNCFHHETFADMIQGIHSEIVCTDHSDQRQQPVCGC